MIDWNKRLENLEDAMVEDILSLSDEEVIAECREDGEDPVDVVGAMVRLFEAVRAQCRKPE